MSMNLESWLLFTATEAALSLSPGPAVMMVVAYGIARGWRNSLFVTLGILTGNAIYFAISATGIGSLILTSPAVFMGIKYLGAAYLVYLGLSAIFGKPSPITLSRIDQKANNGIRIFLSALSLQLTNPKTLLMFVAILPQFIDPQQPVGLQMLILAGCSIIPEFFILLGYGMLASKASHWATQKEYAVITERIAGTLVLSAGVLVALI
ncbi:LysE family translocator [Undibacterium oligocarboniphilum]|uniref:LysE family translocator n=1 Tax=Undibacterium oligocarboniphilum TaxID=666702 RepID=A0A850QH54_9BURK|nr:LysE family translocator [Undibacterium oligocarboniphilum]MBC3868732.1 LysE family translocator [Undibacterium oligocarboniphilum]NVO76713.1 LysE family translocator [Undibacterium oligocarboniphilum]